jgi:cytochrome b involved in lipid metabolism
MAAGKRNSGDGGGGGSSPITSNVIASPLWPVVLIEDQISSAITSAVTTAIKQLAISLTTAVSSHNHHQSNKKQLSPLVVPPQEPKKSHGLKQYSLQEVSEHCLPNDCWIVLFDKIYDVTDFLSEHPGGEFIILESAGRDATLAFRGTRHGKDSYDSLSKYLVGILPESERLYSDEERDQNC